MCFGGTAAAAAAAAAAKSLQSCLAGTAAPQLAVWEKTRPVMLVQEMKK